MPKRLKAGQVRREQRSAFKGWLTTDEEEIERRRLRASIEQIAVQSLEPAQPVFGTFAVRTSNGKAEGDRYVVEIRSLTDFLNSCACLDYRVNGLGTCKHIEAALSKARRAAARSGVQGTPQRVEIHLDRRGAPEIRVAWPKRPPLGPARVIAPFFSSSGALIGDPCAAVSALARAVAEAMPTVRAAIRIGRDVEVWVAGLERDRERLQAREDFLRDLSENRRSLGFLKTTLYEYQREGMMHLAFNERALLADEMGLGKTVQAVAACALLREARRIERVLIVCPASLKAEWEEQIAKFSSLPARLIFGARGERLKQYRESAFFYLVNYEQVRMDADDINRTLAPDVIVLDEAQRIKNWQTVTARSVKRLSSRYAFVLTGTPLENRIDDIYSIFQVLDPHRLGPLFRFNREFYELDHRGQPVGYKNLDELRRRIRPLILRRRKDEVEDQLPARTINNYVVDMAPEQQERYGEYEARVARLAAVAKRRPLLAEEMEKLQRWLACMRMLCDTPFILDRECRVCPKLTELENVLDEALQSPHSKALIFSEWEGMLTLVSHMAKKRGLGFAWHTGTVPQKARRDEINRFKSDPDCRLFLSTDSGGVGLNLQAANVVVNCDLPWNPARLEQRIARAWRKHQTRAVTVVNLVSAGSIEHRMLALLDGKRQLSDGVLDGRGDLNAIKMPSGRAAFLERLQVLIDSPASKPAPSAPAMPAVDAYAALQRELTAALPRLLALEASGDGAKTVVAVVDGAAETDRALIEAAAAKCFANAERPRVEVLDRKTYDAIQRLLAAGALKPGAAPEILYRSVALDDNDAARRSERAAEAAAMLQEAERNMRMSRVLLDGGFAVESLPAADGAVRRSLRALRWAIDDNGTAGESNIEPTAEFLHARCVAHGLLPADAIGVLALLHESTNGGASQLDEPKAREIHAAAHRVYTAAEASVRNAGR